MVIMGHVSAMRFNCLAWKYLENMTHILYDAFELVGLAWRNPNE